MIALDTETTGLDPWHKNRPYLITTCDEDSEQLFWEWEVDPLTRRVEVNRQELIEVKDTIEDSGGLVMQNGKFDQRMIDMLFYDHGLSVKWDWERIYETTLSAHLLASSQPKDLTTQLLVYLGLNVQPFEDGIKEASKKAQRLCRNAGFIEAHGEWALAKVGRADMPSAKGEVWKSDMWLPAAIVKHAPGYLPAWEDWRPKIVTLSKKRSYPGDKPEEHPWNWLCAEYANSDSAGTLPLHLEHMEQLKEKGLFRIYEERRKLLPVVYDMEDRGVVINRDRKDELIDQYRVETERCRIKCIKLADSEALTDLPVGGASNALRDVVFGKFGLEAHKKTKGGSAQCMDREVIDRWLDELPQHTKQYQFIKLLSNYRQRKTAIGYLEGYERFWTSLEIPETGWFLLHPSLNPTGTNTLRFTSKNPNEQNISKKEGFNLRYAFGPAPGRCWASFDYENIELRIPAYGAGEKKMIDLFERADEPPFYGSNHLLNFSTIYPDIWKDVIVKVGEDKAAEFIKTEYKSTWYGRCKNTGFAKQYGAMQAKVDSTAQRPGTFKRIEKTFRNLSKYNAHWVKMARATGYVETMPDSEVSPEQGYPLQCARRGWGDISPTIPLNYHVQGTACWVIGRAMTKVQDYLDRINKDKTDNEHWFITMQVHDELDIDFPMRRGYKAHLRRIKSIMESCGEYIGVPLKVGCDLHENNWSKGVTIL